MYCLKQLTVENIPAILLLEEIACPPPPIYLAYDEPALEKLFDFQEKSIWGAWIKNAQNKNTPQSDSPKLDSRGTDVRRSDSRRLDSCRLGFRQRNSQLGNYQLVGWASSHQAHEHTQETGTYFLSSLVIHPDHRRKGVAKQLLQNILADLQQKQDCRSLQLSVHPANEPALQLYARFGFAISEVRPNLYGPGYNRIVMEYQLAN